MSPTIRVQHDEFPMICNGRGQMVVGQFGSYIEAVEEARKTAVGLVERIRSGDVRHDPHGGDCPHWCDLWPICRKARP